MTKHDWLVLFLRVTGLYFLVTHFSAFVSGVLGLVALYNKAPARVDILAWQMPVAAAIVLGAGLVLLLRAPSLAKWLEKVGR